MQAVSDTFVGVEPVGVPEICQRLGVNPSTLFRWRRRADFPEPQQLASGPVWDWADVDRWYREVHPAVKPGRPRRAE